MKILAYSLIILATIIFIAEIVIVAMKGWGWSDNHGSYFTMFSNICVVSAGFVTIKNEKKRSELRSKLRR